MGKCIALGTHSHCGHRVKKGREATGPRAAQGLGRRTRWGRGRQKRLRYAPPLRTCVLASPAFASSLFARQMSARYGLLQEETVRAKSVSEREFSVKPHDRRCKKSLGRLEEIGH